MSNVKLKLKTGNVKVKLDVKVNTTPTIQGFDYTLNFSFQ